MHVKTLSRRIAAVFTLFLCAAPASAQSSGAESHATASPTGAAATGTSVAVAREEDMDLHVAQNPVTKLISLPFQNSPYFNYGPYREPANVLDVQPVLRFKLCDDWNLITSWVTPIIYRPRISPVEVPLVGVGNFHGTYFCPAHPGRVIWGIGPKL
jgi:hypothetical protein